MQLPRGLVAQPGQGPRLRARESGWLPREESRGWRPPCTGLNPRPTQPRGEETPYFTGDKAGAEGQLSGGEEAELGFTQGDVVVLRPRPLPRPKV